MRKKLTVSAFVIATILLLIISGNQVIIKLFGSFSEKLITEYHELHVLQELKVSLSKTIIYVNALEENTDENTRNNLRMSLEESQLMFENCRNVLTSVHKGDSWELLEVLMTMLNAQINKILLQDSKAAHLLFEQSFNVLSDIIDEIDNMVGETLEEIEEYEVRNNKVILHGTFTVMAFGAILLIFLVFGGMRFIRNLTLPIIQLVEATRTISKGNRNLKVKVDSDDEFQILANSFNSMLEALNETTISEKYLRNILDSLYGALLVTDNSCNIRSLNRTTSKLLGYEENELLDQNIMFLFDKEFKRANTKEDDCDLRIVSKKLKTKTSIFRKNGDKIPVYVTSTVLNNPKGLVEGMVVVGHDLTEEKEQEKKIERIRKEGVIAINEAQENERLRIATDIHDGLGQMLTGISYSIQELEPGQNADLEFLQKIHKQVDTTIQEAKSIAQNLTPIMIKDFGLVAAIQNLVDRTNNLNEIEVVFNAYDFDARIDEKLEKGLYRITQEALNNIFKHSRAKTASIQLFRDANHKVVLVVDDDGIGFDIAAPGSRKKSSGIGLISMRERVYAFDGIFEIESEVGKGTEIMIEVPCIRRKENGKD